MNNQIDTSPAALRKLEEALSGTDIGTRELLYLLGKGIAAERETQAKQEPFAFAQEINGYPTNLFLASEFPGMDQQQWPPGVTVRALYLAPQPAAEKNGKIPVAWRYWNPTECCWFYSDSELAFENDAWLAQPLSLSEHPLNMAALSDVEKQAFIESEGERNREKMKHDSGRKTAPTDVPLPEPDWAMDFAPNAKVYHAPLVQKLVNEAVATAIKTMRKR